MNTNAGLVALDNDVSEAVIGAAFEVANELGIGFLEKVYENALAIELRMTGHLVEQQRPMEVRYRGELVGLYQADLVVDKRVVVELKAVAGLDRNHRAQCLNYLRATGIRTGLVINFGSARVDVQRVICPVAI
jgi:GxxExxY protein